MKRVAILIIIIILVVILDRIILPFNLISTQYPHAFDADPQLPNVLLIGDSTQIRYYPLVKKALEGKANVYRIVELAPQRLHSLFYGGPLLQPVNGSSTKRGQERLNEWLGDKRWDVIHFNWGLHDLVKSEQGMVDHLLLADAAQEYQNTLQPLFERMEETGAQLIFAMTTPVPPESGYVPGVVEALNKAGKSMAEEHGVMINDLYSVVLPQLTEVQNRNDVHFNESGTRMLASGVTSSILMALKHKDLTEQ